MLDEEDVKKFMSTYDGLMQPGRDISWILPGRNRRNAVKLEKLLSEHRRKFEIFYLLYNQKLMATYGFWKRKKGLANSRTVERAYLCYKGRIPKDLPKCRAFVDEGSGLFSECMRNVPVLSPKNQAFVSRAVRDETLRSMAGLPESEGDDKDAEKTAEAGSVSDNEAESAEKEREAEAALRKHVKKRKLYRQDSGSELPWFPHDNHPNLTKELTWEGGSPRWVFYGTPASAAGVLGPLELGSSVVALCFDEHHKVNFLKILIEKAVESMLAGSNVFKNEVLQAKALSLHVTTEPKAKEPKKEPKEEPKKESKKPKKEPKERKSKKKAEDSSSSSSSSSSSEESAAPPPKKPKKEPKKTD